MNDDKFLDALRMHDQIAALTEDQKVWALLKLSKKELGQYHAIESLYGCLVKRRNEHEANKRKDRLSAEETQRKLRTGVEGE